MTTCFHENSIPNFEFSWIFHYPKIKSNKCCCFFNKTISLVMNFVKIRESEFVFREKMWWSSLIIKFISYQIICRTAWSQFWVNNCWNHGNWIKRSTLVILKRRKIKIPIHWNSKVWHYLELHHHKICNYLDSHLN